jgi:hypothetical protein
MVGRHANDKWGKQLVHEIKQSYPQILLANHSYTHANEKYKYFYQHPDMATQDFIKLKIVYTYLIKLFVYQVTVLG